MLINHLVDKESETHNDINAMIHDGNLTAVVD